MELDPGSEMGLGLGPEMGKGWEWTWVDLSSWKPGEHRDWPAIHTRSEIKR